MISPAQTALSCQKHLFDLPHGSSYLNGAYMSPALKASVKAGEAAMQRLQRPFQIKTEDFFEPVDSVRRSFARLINCDDPDRIAITPAASYGFANAARQIKPVAGSNIVVAGGQFPSNMYAWMRLCKQSNCELRTVDPQVGSSQRAVDWNEALIRNIDRRTAAVSIPPLHWSDGTLFDLRAIGEKCRQCGAVFIVDGSQTIGAMPFDIRDIRPDALICATYKCLFGPYGMGLAYYGGFFDDGIPIEENWIVHEGAEDFRNLASYNMALQPKGKRYSSGEHPALVHIAMQQASLDQILEWGAERVHRYCRELFDAHESDFRALGLQLEDRDHRAAHLFGLRLPEAIDLDRLKTRLEEKQVYVSLRGDAVRISLHVYNEDRDLGQLCRALREEIN